MRQSCWRLPLQRCCRAAARAWSKTKSGNVAASWLLLTPCPWLRAAEEGTLWISHNDDPDPAESAGSNGRSVAINFFGLARSLRYTYSSIKTNLIGPIERAGYKVCTQPSSRVRCNSAARWQQNDPGRRMYFGQHVCRAGRLVLYFQLAWCGDSTAGRQGSGSQAVTRPNSVWQRSCVF